MKKHSLILLFLLVVFCAAPVFSQEKSVNKEESANLQKTPASENQCRKYGTQYFVGKPVTVEFVDKNIREVLKFFSEHCDSGEIVIDKSVKQVLITEKFTNVPWNTALNTILQSQDLVVQVIGPILRIAEEKTLEQEREKIEQEKKRRAALEADGTLYTETFKLKNAPCCKCNKDGCQMELTREEFQEVITRRLSKRGRVEIDQNLRTLTVSDVWLNLAVIKELIVLLNADH